MKQEVSEATVPYQCSVCGKRDEVRASLLATSDKPPICRECAAKCPIYRLLPAGVARELAHRALRTFGPVMSLEGIIKATGLGEKEARGALRAMYREGIIEERQVCAFQVFGQQRGLRDE